MSELLERLFLAVRVLRCPRDQLAVLWKSEQTEHGEWTAVYSGHVAESDDPYQALQNVAIGSDREEFLKEHRGEGDE